MLSSCSQIETLSPSHGRCRAGSAGASSTPYTIEPTPYTPHPTPYTLHPTPYTLERNPLALQVSCRLRGSEFEIECRVCSYCGSCFSGRFMELDSAHQRAGGWKEITDKIHAVRLYTYTSHPKPYLPLATPHTLHPTPCLLDPRP